MTIQHYPFEPVELPYDYDALEPFIDARTVDIHYNSHYKSYVDKLNEALEPYPKFHSLTLKRLIFECDYLPRDIRQTVLRSAGGVLNHELYFYSMRKGTVISRFMSDRISTCFGSAEGMENRLAEAAASVYCEMRLSAAGEVLQSGRFLFAGGLSAADYRRMGARILS